MLIFYLIKVIFLICLNKIVNGGKRFVADLPEAQIKNVFFWRILLLQLTFATFSRILFYYLVMHLKLIKQ